MSPLTILSKPRSHSALKCSVKTTLGLGLSENESLASLNRLQSDSLGLSADEFEGDLLGLLGFLSEDGLGLASESLLFGLVSPITNGVSGLLSGLVLTHLMNSVLLCCLAVCRDRFGNVHLNKNGQLPESHNGASAPAPRV